MISKYFYQVIIIYNNMNQNIHFKFILRMLRKIFDIVKIAFLSITFSSLLNNSLQKII